MRFIHCPTLSPWAVKAEITVKPRCETSQIAHAIAVTCTLVSSATAVVVAVLMGALAIPALLPMATLVLLAKGVEKLRNRWSSCALRSSERDKESARGRPTSDSLPWLNEMQDFDRF
jgi:hypothetical protein